MLYLRARFQQRNRGAMAAAFQRLFCMGRIRGYRPRSESSRGRQVEGHGEETMWEGHERREKVEERERLQLIELLIC